MSLFDRCYRCTGGAALSEAVQSLERVASPADGQLHPAEHPRHAAAVHEHRQVLRHVRTGALLDTPLSLYVGE